MSDIPTFIFIRSNSTSALRSVPLDDDQVSTSSLPQTLLDLDRDNSGETPVASHVDSVSNHDLAAMKQMIHEISRDPTLIYSRCDIPQLSQTLTNKYQDWATAGVQRPRAATATEAELYEQESIDERQYQYHGDDDGCNVDYRIVNSLAHARPITPSLLSKNNDKQAFPITPQTQDMMSFNSPTATSLQKRHFNDILPLPFSTAYCQECNGSSPITKSPQTMALTSSMSHDGKGSIFHSSQTRPPYEFRTSITRNFPSTFMMARSA
mmetsp:Transcript_17317/g.29857  ORF Transcript_17317/g.29857 Transcript_17317/m.29857 type:complete len:266 (-) Transcript_17317:111-908(-)